jgi:ADP-heptose:LPS heptosyltransferase
MRHREARYPYVLFANGIGDAILNLPALRALSRVFDGRLGLITSLPTYQTFFRELQLRDLVPTSFWWANNHRNFDADNVAGRVAGCDLLLSLVPWHSPAVDTLLERARPAESIGYFNRFDIQVPLDYGKHTSQLAFDLPRLLDPSVQFAEFLAPPIFPADDVRLAADILACLPTGASLVCLHADTLPEKMWPWKRFSAVVQHLVQRDRNCWVCIVGTKHSMRDLGEHHPRVIPCGGLSLAASCALVARADLFIGVDSCMLHVADFCRVPAVGLFGPTNPSEFGCLIAPHRHIVADCLEDVEPADVIEHVEELWAKVKLASRMGGTARTEAA